MAKFSSKAFAQKIQKKAENAASEAIKEAAPIAKRVMYDTIKETVYDSYSPKIYERRGEDDGLLDSRNIVANVNGTHLRVMNMARPNDSLIGTPLNSSPEGLLYEWIDQGHIYNLFHGKTYSWRQKRMNLTVKMKNKLLKDNEFQKVFNDAMRKELTK